jgi:hypothetical protein
MTTLLESPWLALAVGGLAVAVAGAVFLARRDGASLFALAGVALLTAGMFLVERWVVTERERVEESVVGILTAIESNDVAAVLDWVDPAAKRVQAEVKRLMPEIDVQQTGTMGRIDVGLSDAANPTTAQTTILAYLDGVHRKTGVRVPYYKQRVDLLWVKRGERWLLEDFTAYWRGEKINAASSAAANRAVPR